MGRIVPFTPPDPEPEPVMYPPLITDEDTVPSVLLSSEISMNEVRRYLALTTTGEVAAAAAGTVPFVPVSAAVAVALVALEGGSDNDADSAAREVATEGALEDEDAAVALGRVEVTKRDAYSCWLVDELELELELALELDFAGVVVVGPGGTLVVLSLAVLAALAALA